MNRREFLKALFWGIVGATTHSGEPEDVMVSDRCLTDDEVRELYYLTVTAHALTAHEERWRMKRIGGIRVTRLAHDGTIGKNEPELDIDNVIQYQGYVRVVVAPTFKQALDHFWQAKYDYHHDQWRHYVVAGVQGMYACDAYVDGETYIITDAAHALEAIGNKAVYDVSFVGTRSEFPNVDRRALAGAIWSWY